MAALPENQTNRYFFDYVTGNSATSQEHTLSVRAAFTEGGVQAQDMVLAFVNAIGAATLRVGWRFLRVRYQAANTTFSVPVPLTSGLNAFVGTAAGTTPPYLEALEWAWEGRSFLDGRKVSLSVYGIITTPPDNYRLPAGGTSPAWVASSINVLNGPTNGFQTISGSEPVWYDYVNVQFNSYWERRIRSV